MADHRHYDVVIIGTGAGGGTLGHRLATSGANVLWLERGPFLPRERDNWESTAGPTSAQYAYPPVSHEPRIQQLSDEGPGSPPSPRTRHWCSRGGPPKGRTPCPRH